MTTVLVTGVGAIIGYGVIRSLRAVLPDVQIVGTDIYSDAVGRGWCDVFEQAPLTAHPDYLHWLHRVVMKHGVDLVIPGIEQDTHRLSAEREQLLAFDCQFVLNQPDLIKLASDKWAMHQELENIDEISRIPSYQSGDYLELSTRLGLPFILKPRSSYASKGLVKVRTQSDFTVHATELGDHLIAQPYVGSDDAEYTVGVFGDGQGEVCASITMQRRLAQDGSTAKAWIKKSASLDETVSRLCSHFKPVGPTNLQFRQVDAGWKLLEINPRLSSTTSMRKAFGYNEALMALDFYLTGKLPSQPKLKNGFAVRFTEDYVVYDRDHF